MRERLTEIRVDGFKSLKDFVMPLDQFNVLIGPNGSGKTNVLEFFKLMGLCVSPKRIPAYPFSDWGGYGNLAWSGRENEPISFQIKYTIDSHDVSYDSMITGSNRGRLGILEEQLDIEDYLAVTRGFDEIKYSLKQSFAERAWPIVRNLPVFRMLKQNSSSLEKNNFAVLHRNADISILTAVHWDEFVYRDRDIAVLQATRFDDYKAGHYILPSPSIGKEHRDRSLYELAADYLTNANGIVLLKQLNYDCLRRSTPVNHSGGLEEDGGGLVNLLFRWYNEDRGLPEIFTLALEALFPGWQISFHVTQEGNVILEVRDGTMRLAPTSIPDGFYKLLAVLTAIELGPKILLIDEIETSLHARIIEYITDLLKEADSTVIVTTHSPILVDYADIGDLVIMERDKNVSTCRKIESQEELRQELEHKGITVSDSWLYGEI